jgi:drug/metabolite transporter (DMT)-like permease
MFFLLIALFFSSCIFVVFKFFKKFKISILPAITTNYLLASVLGYLSITQRISAHALFSQPWIGMAIATGITFILTFVVFALSTQRVGVALTVVSGKMSIILSVTIGFLLLSEPFSLLKLSGIIFALLAFYLTNKSSSDVNAGKKYLYLPALIFFGTGANDILMKLSGVYYAGRDETQFLTVTFLTAFSIGLILLIYQVLRHSVQVTLRDIAAGIVLGIFNWYSTFFFIKGLFVLPISIFIPVFNASLVFIAAVAGSMFFNEKLSLVNRVGIILALISIAVVAFS